ncbi:MAG TPA: hypothetical protein VIT85_04125 [Solirubrobacterales bacterium]
MVFGRKSLRELIGEDRQTFWEVVRGEQQDFWKGFRDEQQRTHELIRDLQEEGRAGREEMKAFNREILLRNEKVYTRVIAEMEEGRKQIAANTRAVLSVLDRLEGGTGA